MSVEKKTLESIIEHIQKNRRIIALEYGSLLKNLKDLDDWLNILEGNLK